MSDPQMRFLTDPSLSFAEKLEDARWRKTATPEQVARADEIRATWYAEKDAAEKFCAWMKEIIDRKFAEAGDE